MPPQLLQRISVRWLPEPAYEDTLTIALNVGGYYLDLRVTKEDRSLQWSRAGQRLVVKQEPFTYQWTRLIDSTSNLSSDDATWDWQSLGNGDALEVGTAPCPHKNGDLTSYEEIWRDVTRPGPMVSSWILQSTDGTTFLGCVGDTFLGMRRDTAGAFGVKHEEWQPKQGSWALKFEGGNSAEIPDLNAVLKEFAFEKGKGAVNDTVTLLGVDYLIRGLEAN